MELVQETMLVEDSDVEVDASVLREQVRDLQRERKTLQQLVARANPEEEEVRDPTARASTD